MNTANDDYELGPLEGLASPEESMPDTYPEFGMLPPSAMFSFVPVPGSKLRPEFAFVPCADQRDWEDEEELKTTNLIFQWNILWEAAQIRPSFFENKLPARLEWLRRLAKDVNLYLLPDKSTHKYDAYGPLFHLLPKRTLEQFGLPVILHGHFPAAETLWYIERHFKSNFNERLSQAFAHHVWPLIDSRSRPAHFAKTDPLVVLSHNLNYWLPFAYEAIEDRMRAWRRYPLEAKDRKRYRRIQNDMPEGVSVESPHLGGCVWKGEGEAWEITQEIIASADRSGRLRSIIDAVRSNRIEDDFSSLWSYQREDFERKLYRKRAKVKVTFVQLDDTIPVHGPTSEIHDRMVWEDFETLLDVKERHITVLLRNGHTKVGEISEALGYANHTPVSKTLARIRKKAASYLNLN